jgi:hypothetical protein
MGKQRLKCDELLHIASLQQLSAATLLCDRTRALCRVFPGYMRRWPIDVMRLAERGTAPLPFRCHGVGSVLK